MVYKEVLTFESADEILGKNQHTVYNIKLLTVKAQN